MVSWVGCPIFMIRTHIQDNQAGAHANPLGLGPGGLDPAADCRHSLHTQYNTPIHENWIFEVEEIKDQRISHQFVKFIQIKQQDNNLIKVVNDFSHDYSLLFRRIQLLTFFLPLTFTYATSLTSLFTSSLASPSRSSLTSSSTSSLTSS